MASFRNIFAALIPKYSQRDITDGAALQERSGPSAIGKSVFGRASAVRLNAALRKWSVECEETPTSIRAAASTVVSVDEIPEPDTPANTVEDVSQCMIKESLERSEQSAETNCVEEEEEMNETKDREAEQGAPEVHPLQDYYEVLQISRKAEMETIHRVYRIMALRLHPDNAETGNLERFLLLKRAYHVLSDPAQRAEYDAAHLSTDTQPLPVFESKDFVYGIEGEVNRRLGVLSLLYHKRRLCEGTGGISVLELEKRMAFPREYLNFTLWYLRSKRYITLEENSDYALTSEGVDYVETHSSSNRVIRQLLTSGCGEEDSLSRACSRRGEFPRGGTLVDEAQSPTLCETAAA